MTEREAAIKQLIEETIQCPEGESFTVDFYKPSDGAGVASLFYAVYGDGYPIDTIYIPERLTAENLAGRIRSVVARTGSGHVVSHIALYRSSPPNPNLYEYGLGLTLPAYRRTLAFAGGNKLLMSLLGSNGIDAIFGEAVCNHIITQKLTARSGGTECALEPALMPADAYTTEQSARGRVGCIMSFRVDRDRPRPLCVPTAYQDQMGFLREGLALERELVVPARHLPAGTATLDIVRFPSAGVVRCSITASGEDLPEQLQRLEEELRQNNYALLQCFVPLGSAWAGPVVEHLREAGFFLGGYLPVWFGDDGLLMQKLFVEPCFDDMQIHSERGKQIRNLVQADWVRAQLA